jgi:geranylgeranyl reductase family protein
VPGLSGIIECSRQLWPRSPGGLVLHFEVIVIGAGPAGATAAYECARTGMRVALLEKHKLPRHKTCGGGMPMVVEQYLRDLAPEAFLESEVRHMRHTWKFGDPVLGDINPPGTDAPLSLWMVQRSVFDNALAQRAAAAGADLRDNTSVRLLELAGGGVTVHTDSETLTARHVIGADGANGITARTAGLRPQRTIAIALEVEHPYDWSTSRHPDLRPEVCHLEYGAVPRGYAWVFPKGDHLNIGAGVFRPRTTEGRGDGTVRPLLQATIRQYMDSLGIPHRPEELRYFAHPLPLWNGREPLHAHNGRILLAGDAAGLVNPFFGDGILHAIRSGHIAAQALAGGAASDYTHRIHEEFAANFDAALKLARFFYQWPHLCYRQGVRREQATRTAARLLAGEALFSDVSSRVLRRLTSALRAESKSVGLQPR